MLDVKQILLKRMNGMSFRKLSDETGVSTRTIQDYAKRADEACRRLNISMGDLLKINDNELDGIMFKGNEAYTDPRMKDLLAMIPYIMEELSRKKDTHVTMRTMFREYRAKHPGGYCKTQFYEHVNRILEASSHKVSTPKAGTYPPGEYLFVDFAGDKLEIVDVDTGEVRKVEVFLAVLPYSDYISVMVVENQTVEEFIYALRMCLEELGGVPKVLVPDNLKSAVLKHTRDTLELNSALKDMANHYGFEVAPARPYHPKDKSLVEDAVSITYNHGYALLRKVRLTSLVEANDELKKLVRMYCQSKVVASRGHTREELFHAKERPALRHLPPVPYEVKRFSDQTVSAEGCVTIFEDSHSYTVPHQHVGRKAHVEYTRSMLWVYIDNVCVFSHERIRQPGITRIRENLSPAARYYFDRSPENYIRKAEQASAEFGSLARALFSTRGKGMSNDVIFGILDRLAVRRKKTRADLFDKACSICVENGLLREDDIAAIMQVLQASAVNVPQSNDVTTESHENTRGGSYYS